jgi:hypothetical protein
MEEDMIWQGFLLKRTPKIAIHTTWIRILFAMILELTNGTLENSIHGRITVSFLLILQLLCIIIASFEHINLDPMVSYKLAYDPTVFPSWTLVKMVFQIRSMKSGVYHASYCFLWIHLILITKNSKAGF